MVSTIPLLNLENLDRNKAVFAQFINSKLLENYRLPVLSNDAHVLIGVSGGADSAVLAMFAASYLQPHYPNIHYIFTDTKAEPTSCYKVLDDLESLLGIKITRIEPELGLFELIDQYNGFLPGTKARYCTKELKIKPLQDYISSIPAGTPFISLAGIRYDESDREGVTFTHELERGRSAFPFVDLKVTKADVFAILHMTIGIPTQYAYKSRSGCFS